MSDAQHLANNLALREKTWPWWHESFGEKLTGKARTLIQRCGIPEDEVDAHVYRVRDRAWEICPLPCIGEFWFLEFGLTHHPQFDEIVRLLRLPASSTCSGQTLPPSFSPVLLPSSFGPVVSQVLSSPRSRRLLDLGTCIGQDLRALHFAGVHLSALFGTDLFPGLESVGHSLFVDAHTFSNRFFVADVFDDNPVAPLNATAGMWDVVTMTMFLHQFDRDQQKAAATMAVRLLRHDCGSMIVGNNTGQLNEGEIKLGEPFAARGGQKILWRQSRESMIDFWVKALEEFEESAGRERESWKKRWEVWCEYDEMQIEKREKERKEKGEVRFFQGDQQRRILFCVKRIGV